MPEPIDTQRPASEAFAEEVRGITLEDYLERLGESGWIDGWPDGAVSALEHRVRDAWNEQGPEWAFYALSSTSFDPECIEGDGIDNPCSYAGVIQRLADASRGKLVPDRLQDRFDARAERAEVLLYVEGRRYEAVFDQLDAYFREEALEPLHRALADAGHDDRFLPLPARDAIAHLSFVTPNARWRAVEFGLIPDVAFYIPE